MPNGFESVAEFLPYWDNIRARTMRVAELVPENLIDWSPGAGAMSFADLLRHLAVVERWMFTETACGRPSAYRTHGPELADGKAAILLLMRELHQEAVTLLSHLSIDDLAGKVKTPAGAHVTTAKWLRAMVEHEVHHRGQLYLMLRLCQVQTPPIFGLTSEQLRIQTA